MANTRNGLGRGKLSSPRVTCRSSMASSRAACTLEGARLISSASSRFAKMGPRLGVKVSCLGSKMRVPTTSLGSRSGVNWMRRKLVWLAEASVLMVRVFARPGRPSSSTWPRQSRATSRRFSSWGWPTITFRHSASRGSRGVVEAAMGCPGSSYILTGMAPGRNAPVDLR